MLCIIVEALNSALMKQACLEGVSALRVYLETTPRAHAAAPDVAADDDSVQIDECKPDLLASLVSSILDGPQLDSSSLPLLNLME